MKLSPSTIELRAIVDELGDVKLTASQLRQTTAKSYTLEQCKIALRRVGKLAHVGRYKVKFPEIDKYVQESPTKIKTSHICEKFGIGAAAALGILKRHNRLDRVYVIKPRGDKPRILKLADGQQITARELSQRAKDVGINVDSKLCRKILLDNGLLKRDKLGTCKYPHVYDYVKNNPPIIAADLAKKFRLSKKTAQNILHHCKKRGYQKTILDKAKELPEPITAAEFQAMTGCHTGTAYKVLTRAGRLRPKNAQPKEPKPRPTPKPKPEPKPVIEPPTPTPKKQQNTHPIAILFEAWKAKNEPHTTQRFTR